MELNITREDTGIGLIPDWKAEDAREPYMVFTDADLKEVIRITHDRRVIISGDIYEAAKAFWDAVIQITPQGYSAEVNTDDVVVS